MFHNTIGLIDPALTIRVNKNARQRDVILQLFREHGELSPVHCHNLFGTMFTPLTSIRRAISDLTKEGYLVKTDRMVKGIYGEPNHIWRVKC